VSIRVDQYVHTFRARDAVSDEARLFRDRLRARGFGSTIYAASVEPAVAADVETYDPRRPIAADAVIYHHATVATIGARLARWRGRSALLYHGVTPPAMLRAYDPLLAALLARSRAELGRIAVRFPRRFADSAFGAEELRALGGGAASVLPFALDERRFVAASATSGAIEGPRVRTQAGVRWLSVGRIAPNKGLLALVAAFGRALAYDPRATLTLAGSYAPSDPYYWAVRRAIDSAGAYGHVRLTGSIDDAALVACYAAADVYVCLSEHEGFCVPLVEAMRFDVPIVALARGAVPETLGAAGVVIQANDPDTVAALATELGTPGSRRTAVLAAQRERRAAFDPAAALAAFDAATDALLTGPMRD
jgi:glycosyltransferase involved in cell wall biosynthesis